MNEKGKKKDKAADKKIKRQNGKNKNNTEQKYTNKEKH